MDTIFTTNPRNLPATTTRLDLSVGRACSFAVSGKLHTLGLSLLLAIGCRA